MKDTQTISRKALSEIYPTVCQNWKVRVADLVMSNPGSDKVEVPNNMIEEAYKAADQKQKSFMEKHFDLKFLFPWQVNSIEEVYRRLKVKRSEVVPYSRPKNKRQRKLNAEVDIEHIALLLNGNTKLDWNNHNQYKYFPVFRKDGSGRWVVYACLSWYAGAGLGSGLYYESEEKAMFAAKTFESIYNDYLPE